MSVEEDPRTDASIVCRQKLINDKLILNMVVRMEMWINLRAMWALTWTGFEVEEIPKWRYRVESIMPSLYIVNYDK